MSAACLTVAALEAAADGRECEEAVRAHIASCAACRAAVEEVRANNLFVRRFAASMSQGPPEPPASDAAEAPDLLPGYAIADEIHRGGQGVVYRAVQAQTGRTVAVKMLLGGKGASARQRERFEREVRIAAGLRHPNIVTIYDGGRTSDGRYALAMELIEGRRLDQWCRSPERARGREGLRERLAVMMKVCDGVLCAHQHAVVHRDLKPANILVDGAGQPHILDFGIARSTSGADEPRLTNTGEFAGTLAYTSPEQVSGDPSRVDTRADIYSLGVILYEVISGALPYDVDGPISEAIRNIELETPEPLSRRTARAGGRLADGELSTIVQKALSKSPERRYQTASELRDDLRRYLAGEPIEARRDSAWYVLRKAVGRHRLAFAGTALLVIMLAGFGATMAWQAGRLRSALGASQVDRARLLAGSGETTAAERLVWPELIRVGVHSLDARGAMFTGSPEALNAYWALWDVFRRSPRVARFRGGASLDLLSYFDRDGGRVHALDERGSLWTLALPGLDPAESRPLFPAADEGRFRAAVNRDRTMVLAFGDGRVRLADPATGSLIADRADPEAQFEGAAFSPDGAWIAAIGRDGVLRLADARSLEVRRVIASGAVAGFGWDLFSAPAFSVDGAALAAARSDASLGLWRVADGALIESFDPPESLRHFVGIGVRPMGLAFDSGGHRLAAGIATHVVVWDVDGTAPALVLGPHGATVTSVRFCGPGDGLVLAGVRYTQSAIWDLQRREVVSWLDNALRCTAASDDGRWVVTGTGDLLSLYDGLIAPQVSVLHEGGGFGGKVRVSPDGRMAAFDCGPGGKQGHDVVLINLAEQRAAGVLRGCRDQMFAMEFSPDLAWLYTAEVSGRILKWDLRSLTVEREFREGAQLTRSDDASAVPISLSPDGSMLAVADNGGGVALLDPQNGAPQANLKAGAAPFLTLAFSPDGRLLAGLDAEGVCHVWEVKEQRLVRTARSGRSGTTALDFSADGRVLAMAEANGQGISLLQIATGAVHKIANTGVPSGGIEFHPGGRVVMAVATRAVNLWDCQSGIRLLSLQGHEAPVVSIAMCPDGRTLLSADLSGTLLAWDLDYYAPHIRRALEERVAGEYR